ncbi:TraK domain-containing protein [Pukyongiella litopenaei]|nr:type-F conjugative transfer system secretin TraK [Pukyongiella litopenaei]
MALMVAGAAQAGTETHSVREDGLVRFRASITGITRVSVKGDRITSIVNDDQASVYQVRNDKNTGDIFIRYVGPDNTMPDKEGGYLVTEQGRTVAIEILPIRASTQTIIVKLAGVPATATSAGAASSGDAAGGFAETSIGGGDRLVAQLTDATRKTILRKIRTPWPKSGRNGTLISSLRIGDLVGEVRVASAGASPKQVREQEFYRSGVLAVWVQKNSLAARERSWVVVVRNK